MILGKVLSTKANNSSIRSSVLITKKLEVPILHRLFCVNVNPNIKVLGYITHSDNSMVSIESKPINDESSLCKSEKPLAPPKKECFKVSEVQWFSAFEKKNKKWSRKCLSFLINKGTPVSFLDDNFLKSLRDSVDLSYIGHFSNEKLLQPIHLPWLKDRAYNTIIIGKEGSGRTAVAAYLMSLYAKKFKDLSFIIIDSSGKLTKAFKKSYKDVNLGKLWSILGRSFRIINTGQIFKNRHTNSVESTFDPIIKTALTKSGNTIIIDLSGVDDYEANKNPKISILERICEIIQRSVRDYHMKGEHSKLLVLFDQAELYVPNQEEQEHNEEILRTADFVINCVSSTKKLGCGWIVIGSFPSFIDERIFEEMENRIISTKLYENCDKRFLEKYFNGIEILNRYEWLSKNDSPFNCQGDFIVQEPITVLSRGTSEFFRILKFKEFLRINEFEIRE